MPQQQLEFVFTPEGDPAYTILPGDIPEVLALLKEAKRQEMLALKFEKLGKKKAANLCAACCWAHKVSACWLRTKVVKV